jgi:hypothetical protein
MTTLHARALAVIACVCLAPARTAAQPGWFVQDVATIPACANGVQPTVRLTGLGRDAQAPVVGWTDNCSTDADGDHHPFWFAKNSCSAGTWTTGHIQKPVASTLSLLGTPPVLATSSNGTAWYYYAAHSGDGPWGDGDVEFSRYSTFRHDLATGADNVQDNVGYARWPNVDYPLYVAASHGAAIHWMRGVGYGGSAYRGRLVRDGATLRYRNTDGAYVYLDQVSLKHLAYDIGDDGSHHIVYVTHANDILYTTHAANEPIVTTTEIDDFNEFVEAITTSAPRAIGRASASGVALAVSAGNLLHLVLGGYVPHGASSEPALTYLLSGSGFASFTSRTIATERVASHPSIAINRGEATERACITYWDRDHGLVYVCGSLPNGGFSGNEPPTIIGDALPSARAVGTQLWFRDDTGEPTIAFFDASDNTIRLATQDITDPVTTVTPNPSNWRRAPVTMTMTGNDCPGAGVVAIEHAVTPELAADCTWCSGDPVKTDGTVATRLIETEGINKLRFFATDGANRIEPERIVEVKLDPLPPTIAGERRRLGSSIVSTGTWSNQDIQLSFVCDDQATPGHTASGIAPGQCPSSQTFATEGLFGVTGTVRDRAGNTATTTLEVGIDKTKPLPPTVAFEGYAANNARTYPTAWNWFGIGTARVVVKATCWDSPVLPPGQYAGIDYCSPERTFTQPGSIFGTVTAADRAGNSITVQFPGSGIDRKAPSATVTLLSTPQNGWYTNPIRIAVDCVDGWEAAQTGNNTYTMVQSGIDPNADCGKTIERQVPQSGTNVQVLATDNAKDKAGNLVSPAKYVTLASVDVTPPDLACTLEPSAFVFPAVGEQNFDHVLKAVNATVSPLADAQSGLDGTFTLTDILISGDSNDGDACYVNKTIKENDDDVVIAPADVVEAEFGTADTQFRLRLERCRSASTRVYEAQYEAKDRVGNRKTASCTFTVKPN